MCLHHLMSRTALVFSMFSVSGCLIAAAVSHGTRPQLQLNLKLKGQSSLF